MFSIKKLFLCLSFCLCFALITLSEEGFKKQQEQSAKRLELEHNIILDLNSKTDKVIYDNLIYSSYFCTKTTQSRARCSQFKEVEMQSYSRQEEARELYSHTTASGQAMRFYTTENGIAHLEFQESSQSKLRRYTFTSADKVSDFTGQNKEIFQTENFDWDISYLDNVL